MTTMTTSVEGLLRYIEKLEGDLGDLRQHHKCCHVYKNPSPPPETAEKDIDLTSTAAEGTTASLTRRAEDTTPSLTRRAAEGTTPSLTRRAAEGTIPSPRLLDPINSYSLQSPRSSFSSKAPALKFYSFDPKLINTTRLKLNYVQQWQKVADQFLRDIPIAKKWLNKRETIGLLSDAQNAFAIKSTCGIAIASHKTHSQLALTLKPISVIEAATAYAQAAKNSQMGAALAQQLSSFHTLILVSFCAVLEKLGHQVPEINKVMRSCISKSSEVNLSRLRRGALWVNRMIIDLNAAGFNNRATELFLLCE